MREERASRLALLKRRAAKEEEAEGKEDLVCLFPERHRNCYMELPDLTYISGCSSIVSPPFPQSSLPTAPDAAASPLSYPGTSSSWVDCVHSPYLDPRAQLSPQGKP